LITAKRKLPFRLTPPTLLDIIRVDDANRKGTSVEVEEFIVETNLEHVRGKKTNSERLQNTILM